MDLRRRVFVILMSISIVLSYIPGLAFAETDGAVDNGQENTQEVTEPADGAADADDVNEGADLPGVETRDADDSGEDPGRWGGTEQDGGTIVAGETKDVVIENSRDYVSFEFKPTVSGEYSFYSTGTYDTYGQVLDSDKELIGENDDSSAYNFKVTFEAEAGETYYLQAAMYGTNTGSFTVELVEGTGPVELGRWQGDEIDGGSIAVNETKTVSIQSPRDYTSFTFVPVTSGWYSFHSMGDEDTYGQVLDSEWEFLSEDDDDYDDSNFDVTFEAVAGETYYLQATLYDPETGSFSVEVTETTDPGDDDDDDDDDDDGTWDVRIYYSSYGAGRYFTSFARISEYGEHGTLTGYWYRTENGQIIDEDVDNPIAVTPAAYDEDEDEVVCKAENLPVQWPNFLIIVEETDENGEVVATKKDTLQNTFDYRPAEGDDVESAAFVPAEPIVLKYRQDGEMATIRDDDYQRVGRYFKYRFPGFKEGDKFEVVYNDGKPDATYVYTEDEDSWYNYTTFVNENDETGEDSVSVYNSVEQREEVEWEANSQQVFKIYVSKFGGYVDCPVSIVLDESEGEFGYEAINGTYARITRYNGSSRDVAVPETVGNYIVQEIGPDAFAGTNITSVTLPDTVEVIGDGAFESCKSMTSIDLGKSIKTIGNYAFNGCTAVSSFGLPDTLTKIGDYSFAHCTSVTEFVLPDSIKTLGDYTFAYNPSLASVNYPKSLTSTYGNLFVKDDLITEFVIPEGVTKLASGFFKGCDKLSSVTLPTSLVTIDANAFEGCTSLTNITLPADLQGIGSLAFYDCDGLTEIRIPDTVTSIGERAFAYCDSLQSINYPASLKSTGGYILDGTPNVKEITVPNGVLSIPEYAFRGCKYLTKVNLPEGLKEINIYAFNGCTGLESVVLPDSIETLRYDCFSDCSNLSQINYPKSLKSSGGYVFQNDLKLRKITVPEGVTALPSDVFEYCDGLVTVELPDSLEKIGDSAFSGCSSLRNIEIPDGVTDLGEYTFYNCSALTRIKVPASAVSIKRNTFYNCTNLEAIWIGNQVTSINSNAFTNCSKDKLVIHGVEGSYAQTWAEENGYQFSAEELVQDDSSFSGTVTDAGGNGIEGIAVIIYDEMEKKVVYREYTDASGNWSNSEVTKGRSYTIYYSCSNYSFSNNYFKETAEGSIYIETVIAELVNTDAETIDPADFTYTVNSGNNITITGYNGSAKVVSIPAVIGDYRVTQIGEGAFRYKDITGVIIPEGVTHIESYAFNSCSALSQVLLPSTLTNIGSNAFYYCTSLKAVDLPLGLDTISSYAFANCSGLTEIAIPDSVTKIYGNAFAYCTDLEKANYPLALEEASGSIFAGDVKLTSFTVPEGVTEIADEFFRNGNYITTVHLPDSLTEIGRYAFYGCTALSQINIPASVTRIGYYAFKDCTSLTEIELPEALVRIDDWAFSGCKGLTSIHLPDGLTNLGQGAFANCTELEEVNYPVSLVSSGTGAFENDPKLTEITVPDGVTKLADYAFSGFTQLTKVNLPDSLTTIGIYAFYHCTSLEEVALPASVTEIGESAFSGCTGFTEFNFPSALTRIGSYAFNGCTGLTEISIPDSVTYIGARAFSYCSELESANYPVSLAESGTGVYYEDPKLTEITVPEGVTVLAAQAFNGNNYLTKVTLPESLTEIGASAFRYCYSLTDITIPSGVTTIKNYAFDHCSSLKRIEIPDSVTAIYYNAFSYCSALEEAVLPDTLQTLGESSFSNCSVLSSINYPKSLTSAGANVFYNDPMLRSMTVPEGVTAIPGSVFRGAAFLTEISLPDGLKSIGRQSFYGCSGITSITLPDSVESIAYNAFGDCDNLSSINYPKSLTTCEESIFNGDTKLKSITVPDGVTALPANVFSYANGLVTVKLPDGLTTIGDSAFYSATGLKRVIIPDSVTSIAQHAFNNCTSLVKMVIPSKVTEIGYRVFRNNTSLEAIWIGSQVTSINNNAFQDCSTDKLTIHGVAGSTANLWANEKGYTFLTDEVVIDENIVSGVVNDSEGNGLEGINVSVYDELEGKVHFSGTTDADGSWECSDLISGRKYTVTYGKTNYSFSRNNISIEAGVDTEIETVIATKIVEDLVEGDPADFTYEQINGTDIRITGYTGSSKKIAIPEVIDDMKVTTIGSSAFSGSSLTVVAVPEGVTEISDYAFSGSSSLKQVLLPSTLVTISSYAFRGCTVLESIELPYGLNRIRSNAFNGCSKLTEVMFPDTVREIEYSAFSDCASLETIGYPKGLKYAGSNIFSNDPKLNMIEVPEGVTNIPSQLFEGCTSLNSVVLPESLRTIESYAFESCTGLTSVKIPDGVTSIGSQAFSGCSNLASVNYPASLTYSEGYVFNGCTKLKTATIPDGVKTVYRLFNNADGITEITLPDSVETIEQSAFSYCSSLKTIMLPSSLKTVNSSAFNGCSGLLYAIYSGTEDEWNANVTIGDYNAPLANALVFNGGTQIVPPVAPDLYAVPYGHKQIRLSWNYSGDKSLVKRYVIDRSSNGISYSSLRSVAGTSTEYIDTLSFTGESKTFYYRITVYDKYDRTKTSSVVMADAVSTDHEAPVAVINPGKNSYTRTGDDCKFSAAMSTDNDAIASYRWTFDDGTRATGRDVTHRFSRTGVYTVTLEVTDVNGNTGTTSVQITAIDPNDPHYTLLKLTVCDADTTSQIPIRNAQVSITTGENTDTFEADNNGQVIQIVKSGEYVISAAAGGYLPRTVKIIAEGGIQENTIGLASKSIMSGSITVHEMQLQEIIDAGIDVNAEGNNHVTKFETKLTFTAGLLEYEFPIEILKNNNGEIVRKTGGGFFDIGNPYDSGDGVGGLRLGIFPISEKFVLVIYGEVHWLKEMYKVELVVNNKSSTDTLEDIHGELMLPDGMSLADMVSGSQSAEHDLGRLDYNSDTSTEWYIRGDKEGEYNIAARVTATSMPYGEVLEQIYETESPVKVYAGSALHMTITCPDMAERGKEYTVKYRLENVSDKSLYNLSFGITGSEQYKLLTYQEKESQPMYLNHLKYGDAWTRKVDELAPGGYIELEVSTTIWFNSALELLKLVPKVGSFIDIAYYLNDVTVVMASENTTDIPYTIVIERADRPSLIDKIIDETVSFVLEKAGIELPGGSLGSSVIEIFGEGEVHGISSAKGAKTMLKLAQGQTNSTLVVKIDDGRGDDNSIQNDVVRVTSGTFGEGVVDILNHNSIKVGPGGVSIEALAPGTAHIKIGVENKFGELEQEYEVDYIVHDNETKSSVSIGKDGITGKYKVDAANFEETVSIHKAKELEEYTENPYQKLDSAFVVDVSGHTEDTNYTVSLTADQVSSILDNTAAFNLDVKGKEANVSYSREALESIETKGGDVDLSVEKLTLKDRQALNTSNPVYVFTATTTSDPYWNYTGGPVTVEVPYEIKEEESQKSVFVRHIKEDGTEEMLDAVYDADAKTVTFVTTSFSYFEIVGPGMNPYDEEAFEKQKDLDEKAADAKAKAEDAEAKAAAAETAVEEYKAAAAAAETAANKAAASIAPADIAAANAAIAEANAKKQIADKAVADANAAKTAADQAIQAARTALADAEGLVVSGAEADIASAVTAASNAGTSLGTITTDKAAADSTYTKADTATKKAVEARKLADQPKEIQDLKAIKIKKLKGEKKKATVSWKKLTKKEKSKIQGLEVQWSLDGFKTIAGGKTVKKTKTSFTIKKLKSKKKYYVRIRAYKMVNGIKHVSAWKKKTVKIK